MSNLTTKQTEFLAWLIAAGGSASVANSGGTVAALLRRGLVEYGVGPNGVGRPVVVTEAGRVAYDYAAAATA